MWQGHPEEQPFRGTDSSTSLRVPPGDPSHHQKDGQGTQPPQRPPSLRGLLLPLGRFRTQPVRKVLSGTAVRRLSCLGAHIHSGLSKTTNFLCTQPHWPSTLQEIDTPPTPGYNLVFSRISSPCNIRPCTPLHQTNRQEQKHGFFFLKWGSFQSEFR